MSQSVILLVAVFLSSGLTYLMMCLSQRPLNALLDAQRDQIRELLNRIQSKDLHAFSTMQANTAPVSAEEPMYLRSDEAEAKRMVEMFGAVEGIGDVIYSDEELGLLSDLGQ